MKWIFIAALLIMIPAIAASLRARPKYLLQACFVLGALPFFLNFHLYVAPISWAYWPGIVKGVEVSLLDGVALGILLATHEKARTPTAIKAFFAIYVAGLAISTIVAQQPVPAIFYAWQLLRCVLVYLAVTRATVAMPKAALALVLGMGCSVLFESVVAVLQYLQGSTQAGGTLGHRTMIGILSHSAVMPACALMLAGYRKVLGAAIVVAGAAIAYVGASRATIGLYGLGLVITILLSIRHKPTSRKTGLAAIAMLALVVGAPLMQFAIERRSTEALISSNQERTALIDAAHMIISDHPLGVGANNYVLVANLGGYSDRAGVSWFHESRSAPVHNSFLLVLAELGWIGFIGLLGFVASVVLVGWAALRRLPSGSGSELFVGVLAALIVSFIHSGFEWIPMDFRMHYMFAMDLGVLVGILNLQMQATGRQSVRQISRKAVGSHRRPATV